MRLYKPKDVPKQVYRNATDSPPDSPSSSSGSPTPHKLRRAAEAVSKQISGHKAMVAHFKETRLPRPPIFSMRSATPPQTDHSLPTKQSKTTKRSANSQNIPVRPPSSNIPASTNAKQRSAPLSSINTNLLSPTKPPGLGFEKSTTRATKVPAPLSASGKSKPVPSFIHSPSQRASAPLATCPNPLASTRTDLSTISVTSASDEVDIDAPLLSGSCFNSPEEDSELEDDLFEMAELSPVSSFEAQVAQIFGTGLGPVAEKEVIRRGEIAAPIATPEPSFAPTVKPMSAAVGWWEPANNAAVEHEVPTDSEPKGRPDGSGAAAPDQNQDPCTPKNIPTRPLSSTDYEYVASMGQDAFFTLSLGIHKRSQRKCLIKVISNAIVEEGSVIRAVLEEQRIMRQASDYPFLLGLVASFHDANGFYLISDYCRSTLFDERAHMPESRKKLASAELACAVDHLHSLGIIHRDIKPENVMLKNDGHVVLGNFGLALRLGAPCSIASRRDGSVRVDKSKTLKARGICGTLPYMAPEMLSDKEYSYGVDWFSYGVFLHVFYTDKFPWMGKYEYPASYLKEMTSMMSLGFILENRLFGDLLNKLLCVNEDARANFSVIRGARFFADFDWQSVIPLDSPSPSVSPRPTGDELPLSIGNNSQHHIDSDPYSGFTWLNPSIVEESKADIGSADWSPESSVAVAKPYTPSQLDGPTIERSPFACGSLQYSSSFSLSYLYRHSTFDFDPESHINNVLRRLERPLGEDPVSASPAECAAAAEDSNVYLGGGTVAIPACDSDNDEALVRMSIKSLDIGEQPVFDLPSGWKEAFAPPTGIAVPPSSKPHGTKKSSVLPKFKTLWKRVASKFVSRRV